MFVVDHIILVAGVLLLLGIGSSKLSARLGIPGLVLFLVLGMLAGSDGPGGIDFENYSLAHAIGTVALMLILFDGGFSTPLEAVRSVWKPSFVLATIGVLLTGVITGAAASYILGIPLLPGMLLGSIVSSTDAAAVFAVLRSGGISLPKRLASLLEVESGSNDPMAIFLTVGCIEMLLGTVNSATDLLWLLGSQMIVGVLMGWALGRLAAWLVNRIDLDSAGLYPVLVTTCCLITFGLTAEFGGSGFLAAYVAGIVLGNTKLVMQRGIRLYHNAIAWLCQIVMFVMLGLLSFPTRLLEVKWQGLLIAAVLSFVARPLAVALSWGPFRPSWREFVFVSWVGLKGAVPITLATFPLMLNAPYAGLIFDVVFFVVVISALVQGSTLAPLANWLGLKVAPEPAPPVTLEISSLRHVEGEVLDYSVSHESRAAGKLVRDLALPDGVVIALVVRGHQLIPPQGKTRIEAGDHVMLVVRPGTEPLVSQTFGRSAESRGAIPLELEFPLRGSATVGVLQDLYGLALPAAPETTLDAALRAALGAGEITVGREATFGPLRLRVLSLSSSGKIEMVGMTILPEPTGVQSSTGAAAVAVRA